MKRVSERIRLSATDLILGDMDAEIAALEDKLAKARMLKQGMMQQLLTGKIRLIRTHEHRRKASGGRKTRKF